MEGWVREEGGHGNSGGAAEVGKGQQICLALYKYCFHGREARRKLASLKACHCEKITVQITVQSWKKILTIKYLRDSVSSWMVTLKNSQSNNKRVYIKTYLYGSQKVRYINFRWNFRMNLNCSTAFTGEPNMTISKLMNVHVQLFNVSLLFHA